MVDDGTGYIALAPAIDTDIQFGGPDRTVTAWTNTTSMQVMAFIGKFNTANNGTHEAQDHFLGFNFSVGLFTEDNCWVGSMTEMLRDNSLLVYGADRSELSISGLKLKFGGYDNEKGWNSIVYCGLVGRGSKRRPKRYRCQFL